MAGLATLPDQQRTIPMEAKAPMPNTTEKMKSVKAL